MRAREEDAPIANRAEYGEQLLNERMRREFGAVPLGTLRSGQRFRVHDGQQEGTVVYSTDCSVLVTLDSTGEKREVTFINREGEVRTAEFRTGPRREHWARTCFVRVIGRSGGASS